VKYPTLKALLRASKRFFRRYAARTGKSTIPQRRVARFLNRAQGEIISREARRAARRAARAVAASARRSTRHAGRYLSRRYGRYLRQMARDHPDSERHVGRYQKWLARRARATGTIYLNKAELERREERRLERVARRAERREQRRARQAQRDGAQVTAHHHYHHDEFVQLAESFADANAVEPVFLDTAVEALAYDDSEPRAEAETEEPSAEELTLMEQAAAAEEHLNNNGVTTVHHHYNHKHSSTKHFFDAKNPVDVVARRVGRSSRREVSLRGLSIRLARAFLKAQRSSARSHSSKPRFALANVDSESHAHTHIHTHHHSTSEASGSRTHELLKLVEALQARAAELPAGSAVHHIHHHSHEHAPSRVLSSVTPVEVTVAAEEVPAVQPRFASASMSHSLRKLSEKLAAIPERSLIEQEAEGEQQTEAETEAATEVEKEEMASAAEATESMTA